MLDRKVYLLVSEAAQLLDLSPDTIRRWDKKGLIKSFRDENNYRRFNIHEVKRVQDKYLGNSAGRGFYVMKSEPTNYTCLELFAGAGGLALGLENAGFQTVMLNEFDKQAATTIRTNQPNWNLIEGDVRELDFEAFAGKVDVVSGGFPCQAFSYAGQSRGFEDTRGTLFFDFARCVNQVRPKIALGENVRGLENHNKGKTLSTMLNVLDSLGYDVQYQVLKAQFYDVPQKRERLFMIAVRKDLQTPIYFPKENDYILSVREAFENIPPSEGAKYPKRKQEIMAQVPPGGYWKNLPEDLAKEYMNNSYYLGGGKTGMARRLAWEEPSLTLTCNPGQKQTERCHPEETRPLNVREYARLQTFPDDWEFTGSIASQYKQIGNAVPVNLAYHVGRCLIAMLDGTVPENSQVIAKAELETPRQLQLL
jgi:DNA (cytosine-5)-methyltransferase 1